MYMYIVPCRDLNIRASKTLRITLESTYPYLFLGQFVFRPQLTGEDSCHFLCRRWRIACYGNEPPSAAQTKPFRRALRTGWMVTPSTSLPFPWLGHLFIQREKNTWFYVSTKYYLCDAAMMPMVAVDAFLQGCMNIYWGFIFMIKKKNLVKT